MTNTASSHVTHLYSITVICKNQDLSAYKKTPSFQLEVFSRKDTEYENRKRMAKFIRRACAPS